MKKKLFTAGILLLVLLFGTAAAFGESSAIKIKESWSESKLTISASSTIRALYIEYSEAPGEYTIEGAKSLSAGGSGFLHEFIDLGAAASESLELCFAQKVSIKAAYAFDGADTPAWVQKWEEPLEEADLLLISGHADDEQLFFAGVLPYYSQLTDYTVQVLYATDHSASSGRQHERLDGLWAVGVRNYPLSLGWPDYYSESAEGAVAALKSIDMSFDKASAELRAAIEACKPQLIVSHDLKGEYGHGMHMLIARTVKELPAAWLEENSYIKKIYLHLYPENPVVLGFMDEPFPELNGLSPFQVTQKDGFAAHKSQHWTWFNKWLYGANKQLSKASEIKTYNPACYGLLYSAAGEDVLKNDFFENVKSRAQQKEEAEAMRRAEEERIAKEEQERLRLEEEERLRQEELAEKKRASSRSIAAFAAGLLIIIFVTVRKGRRGKHGKH